MFHAPHQTSPLSKKLMGQIAFLDVTLNAFRQDRKNLYALRQSIRSVQSIRATCHAIRHFEMELLASHLEGHLTALRDDRLATGEAASALRLARTRWQGQDDGDDARVHRQIEFLSR